MGRTAHRQAFRDLAKQELSQTNVFHQSVGLGLLLLLLLLLCIKELEWGVGGRVGNVGVESWKRGPEETNHGNPPPTNPHPHPSTLLPV